ncbi:hypothetical protein HYPSUDRAFT_150319 [Hypholoma sublateritium FD-334 SS-4]|uniref:Uncharacterized protein n=1 Tax=Hypholoma sublateritium (strain FD-334 SS-4) TaxID=945553 RepID=A0A0D2ND32_HYPSF|nr:hypothetical protein HYPSUDRAFT_150319 [Hypholoma sublateritium FD-334 SS-4]
MSRPYKPLTSARLNDTILGCFAHVKPSETLDHLVRYLGTWSGSELLQVIQYVLKLVVPFLELRARLQHRAGLRAAPKSTSADSYSKFSSFIGDSRTLWRIWGLLPIFQWLISLERSPPATRKLLTIERLQGWSMLAYYPLEHLYYLGAHGIIPAAVTSPFSLFSAKKTKLSLNFNKIALWSTRFWAAYVFLHFAHLVEDRKLLKLRHTSMRKAKASGLSVEEKEEMNQRWDAFWSEVVINMGYLPLTIHWSMEGGLFRNETWVAVFGLVAAVASFRTGWKATALPRASPPAKKEVAETAENVVAYDVTS